MCILKTGKSSPVNAMILSSPYEITGSRRPDFCRRRKAQVD